MHKNAREITPGFCISQKYFFGITLVYITVLPCHVVNISTFFNECKGTLFCKKMTSISFLPTSKAIIIYLNAIEVRMPICTICFFSSVIIHLQGQNREELSILPVCVKRRSQGALNI